MATCWICGGEAHPDPAFDPHNLSRCGACGFVFAAGRGDEDLAALYGDDYILRYPRDHDYATDEPQRRFEARRRVGLVRSFADGGRLLEVGAATGAFLAEARDRGFAPLGIEPSEAAAQHARGRGVEVVEGVLEDVALEAASFDAICAWHVLEHLQDPRAVLVRLRSALRPGGVLALEVPNIESVAARRELAGWWALDPLHHVAHYAPATLHRLVDGAGLEVLELTTVDFATYHRWSHRLNPRALAYYAAKTRTERVWPFRADAVRHELLRVVARRPA